MAQDHDSREDSVSRRHALERMMWAGTGVLWAVSGSVSKRFSLFGRAEAASAMAQTKPTILILSPVLFVLLSATASAAPCAMIKLEANTPPVRNAR